MLDENGQSSPRVIEDAKCLPLVRCDGDLYRIVGTRGNSFKVKGEEDIKYYDLWADNGQPFMGAHIFDVPAYEVEFIKQPKETNAVCGSNNGWVKPYIAVENS